MALEEVLKHECESGFVIEISETDAADSADHKKEFFKMIVTPRRDEVVTASKSEIKETKKFESSPKTSESDDQVKLEAPALATSSSGERGSVPQPIRSPKW